MSKTVLKQQYFKNRENQRRNVNFIVPGQSRNAPSDSPIEVKDTPEAQIRKNKNITRERKKMEKQQIETLESFPISNIVSITTTISSPDDIRKNNIVEIKEIEDLERIKDSKVCNICKEDRKKCKRHNARIEFKTKKDVKIIVYNPNFITYIAKLLTITCPTCYRIKLEELQMKDEGISSTSIKSFLDKATNLYKTKSMCPRECNSPNIIYKVDKANGDILKTYDVNVDASSVASSSTKSTKNTKDKKKPKEEISTIMNVQEVYDIVKKIDPNDLKLMGYKDKSTSPLNFFMENIEVIDPANVSDSSEFTNEVSKIYTNYKDILNIINSDIEISGTISVDKIIQQKSKDIYREVFRLLDSSSQIRNIVSRKSGRFRNNLMGKRIGNCARTVITPEVSLKFGQVSVPRVWAKTLTVQEIVTSYNIIFLTALLIKREINMIERNNEKFTTNNNINYKLRIGDVIHRHLRDGDKILIGRQPTLSGRSIKMFEVVLYDKFTIGIPLASVGDFAGDFDGDEMWMYVVQKYDSRAEIDQLLNVRQNFKDTACSKFGNNIVYDDATALRLLTNPDAVVAFSTWNNCVNFIGNKESLPTLERRLKDHSFNNVDKFLEKVSDKLGIPKQIIELSYDINKYYEGDSFKDKVKSYVKDKFNTEINDIDELNKFFNKTSFLNLDYYLELISNYQGDSLYQKINSYLESGQRNKYLDKLTNIFKIYQDDYLMIDKLAQMFEDYQENKQNITEYKKYLDQVIQTISLDDFLDYLESNDLENYRIIVDQANELLELSQQINSLINIKNNNNQFQKDYQYLKSSKSVEFYNKNYLNNILSQSENLKNYTDYEELNTKLQEIVINGNINNLIDKLSLEHKKIYNEILKTNNILEDQVNGLSEKEFIDFVSKQYKLTKRASKEIYSVYNTKFVEPRFLLDIINRNNFERFIELISQYDQIKPKNQTDQELVTIYTNLSLINKYFGEEDRTYDLFRYHQGKDLYSLVLPEDFDLKINSSTNPVIIKEGILVTGVIGKAESSTISNTLVNQYDGVRINDYISDLSFVLGKWLEDQGFTIGISDCEIDQDEFDQKMKEKKDKIDADIFLANNKSKNKIIEQKIEKDSIAAVDTVRNIGQKLVIKQLGKNNPLSIMRDSGKGGEFNSTQIAGSLFQQYYEGARINNEMSGKKRSSPYFSEEDTSVETRGYINSSFYNGLTPSETMVLIYAGREGQINIATSVASTGHLRNIFESQGKNMVLSNGSVISSNGNIYQFTYGGDNFDPAKIVFIKTKKGRIGFPLDFEQEIKTLNNNTFNLQKINLNRVSRSDFVNYHSSFYRVANQNDLNALFMMDDYINIKDDRFKDLDRLNISDNMKSVINVMRKTNYYDLTDSKISDNDFDEFMLTLSVKDDNSEIRNLINSFIKSKETVTLDNKNRILPKTKINVKDQLDNISGLTDQNKNKISQFLRMIDIEIMTYHPVYMDEKIINKLLQAIPKPQTNYKENNQIMHDRYKEVTSEVLSNLRIMISQIPKLRKIINYKFIDAYIENGNPVGPLAASAISQPITQAAISSSKHNVGVGQNINSIVTMINNIFRYIKSDKFFQSNIFFKNREMTYNQVYDMYSDFVNIDIRSILDKYVIDENRNFQTKWNYYNNDFNKEDDSVILRLYFKLDMLYKHKISLVEIENIILKESGDLFYTHSSPTIYGVVDIKLKTAISEVTQNIDPSVMKRFDLSNSVIENLLKIKLKGYSNIKGLVPQQVDVISLMNGYQEKQKEKNTWKLYSNQIVKIESGLAMDLVVKLFKLAGITVKGYENNGNELTQEQKEELFYIDEIEIVMPNQDKPLDYISKLINIDRERQNEKEEENIRKGVKVFKDRSSKLLEASKFNYAVTQGTNLSEILFRDDIDDRICYSNSYFEMLELYGIEITRTIIAKQILKMISGVDPRHIMIFVDIMVNRGTVDPISPHGSAKQSKGPLSNAADHSVYKSIIDGAISAKKDNTKDSTIAIMLGQDTFSGAGYPTKIDYYDDRIKEKQRLIKNIHNPDVVDEVISEVFDQNETATQTSERSFDDPNFEKEVKDNQIKTTIDTEETLNNSRVPSIVNQLNQQGAAIAVKFMEETLDEDENINFEDFVFDDEDEIKESPVNLIISGLDKTKEKSKVVLGRGTIEDLNKSLENVVISVQKFNSFIDQNQALKLEVNNLGLI